MRKKSLALLLVLVMLLGLAAPTALAEEPEDPALTAEESVQEQEEVAVTETVDTSDIALADNDELFAGYVNQLLYPSRGGVSLLANWGSSAGVLNDNERDIYNQLKGEIEDVAASGGSTEFALDVNSLNITWTGSSDGYKNIIDTSKIIDCLLVDCPYELYWYDKTAGAAWSMSISSSGGTYRFASLTVTFSVAQDYRGGNNTTVNASKVTAAKTAAGNAQAIVSKYAGKSDYEKLEAYKDEICDLVSYNDQAAGSGYTGGYGDPWQIIYVFDGDGTTSVVCEGYAKAFQYLCDLSGLTCYTVSGQMKGGTGAGGHMWNIVTLDGANYLVDVTNCDEGTVGYPDDLFLKAASGSVDDGYTVHGVTYEYDADMVSLYGSSILTLSGSDYTPPKTLTGLTATATYNGQPISDYTIDVPLKGQTKTVTLTATATYDDNSTGTVNAEWKLTNESYWGVEISGNQLIIQPDAGVLGDTISIEVAASYGGQTAYVTLSLVKNSAIVTSFNISGPDSITIPNSGDNTAQYFIKDIYDQYGGTMSVPDNVQWSISGVEGVSVDETTGVVTVTDEAASGTATLTATCGSVHKDFSIDIRSKENAEVTITGVPTEVVEGSEGFELYANVAGVNPTKGFEWTSSNELVLSVQNWGSGSQQAYAYIAVKGPGTATITATYEDEDYYGQASVTITVLKQPALSNFTYTLPSDIVYNGAEHAVDVAVKSGITGMGEYTVFYNGSETAPVNAGTYDVTLRVEEGTLYTAATLELGTLTIAKATPAITVNPTLEVTKNTTQSLNATISNKGTLTYKSSNTRVATVDENGNVTGVKEGTATITISYAGDSNYNRASETVTVTVTDKKLVDVTFTAKDNQTYKPEGYKLGAQFSEATVDGDKTITKYIYNGTEYATLDALNAVTVTDAGTYTVTAVYESDTEYGEAKATFTIEPKDISTSGSVTLSSTSVTYTGTQAPVSVTSVVMDGHTLTASVDYTVSIPAAINAGTYTVTVTGQGNYTGTATTIFEITKATATEAMTTVSADARYGTAGTVALDLAGGTAGTIAVSDASNVLNGTPTLNNGVLSFAFVDSEANVDKTATITIPVTGAPNYNDYTITVTVTVVDKFLPVLTVKDITTTYTGSPVSASLIRGTAVYEGATVKGTWGWTSTVPTNAGTHSVSVTFTPENTDIYANATATVTVTINKATPAGSPGYTSIKEPGKTLKDAALTTGSFKVDGEIKWEDSEDTVVQANVSYKWTFTPDDAANYNVVTGSLTPYRVSSDHDSSPAVGSPISAPTASNGSVRVNPGRAEKGDTVTITAIPDKGFVLESIVVTDRNGDTIRLTDEGDGVFTFTMPSTAITVKTVFVPEGTTTPVSGDMDFADVGESHWAYNEIAWAYENGYMTGTSAATFNPSGTVSRQQVWTILARMAGADPADMAEAKAWSVASGISDGSNPGGAVSRQQLVSLLYRFAAQYGYDITAKADLSGYPDTVALASYATDAMAWSVANGIIGGTTQGTLNPAGTANRGQLAAILWRFYQTTAI